VYDIHKMQRHLVGANNDDVKAAIMPGKGGLASQPWRHVGFNVSGNFIRTTGAGEISGEPPTFGPMTWPLITATAYYDFPQAGRLSIDLQRTYYLEELVHGNDFQANLLTLRWTKDF